MGRGLENTSDSAEEGAVDHSEWARRARIEKEERGMAFIGWIMEMSGYVKMLLYCSVYSIWYFKTSNIYLNIGLQKSCNAAEIKKINQAFRYLPIVDSVHCLQSDKLIITFITKNTNKTTKNAWVSRSSVAVKLEIQQKLLRKMLKMWWERLTLVPDELTDWITGINTIMFMTKEMNWVYCGMFW